MKTPRIGFTAIALIAVASWSSAHAQCSGTTVDFEDDTMFGNFTCPGDPNCNPLHHAYLLAKGFDILGSPPGYVWSTQFGGPMGTTGIIVGFAEPDHTETDEGLSTGEMMTVDFMAGSPTTAGPVKSVRVVLQVMPITANNNVSSTVTLDCYNAALGLVGTSTVSFTGVTVGVLTPGAIQVTSAATDIATARLTTSVHPFGGLFVESICYEGGAAPPPSADFGDAPDNAIVCEALPFATPPPSDYPTVDPSTNAIAGRTGPYHLNITEVRLGLGETVENGAKQAPCDWISGGCDEDDSPFLLCLDPIPGGCRSGVVVTPGGPCVRRAFGVFGPYPGNPCFGMWLFNAQTTAAALPANSYRVNVGVDWNLSRSFGDVGGEWPLVDFPVSIGPGAAQNFITPPFTVITAFLSGASWAIEPFWTRFTVAEEAISATFPGGNWDGSGPIGGNRVGETEDWVPFGDPPNNHPSCEIAVGYHLYKTPDGGGTTISFSGTPLPAGFFGPGSDPFTGTVSLKGQPLTTTPPGVLNETDAVIRRLTPAYLDSVNTVATVQIELVALSLQSVQPITVTAFGGTNPQTWDVSVSGSTQAPQPQGTMTIRSSTCGAQLGGTFDSNLPVRPHFIFTRVGHPGDVRVYDQGMADVVTFSCTNERWLSFEPPTVPPVIIPGLNPTTVNGGLGPVQLITPILPNFFPGIQEDRCLSGECGESEIFRGRVARANAAHATWYRGPSLRATSLQALRATAIDSDGDGIEERVDNCPFTPNTSQQDQDRDGVGDVCDNCNLAGNAGYNACQEDGDNDGIGDRCEITGVPVASRLPSRMSLAIPQPNPVRDGFSSVVHLSRSGHAVVRAYDSGGRLVASVLDSWLPAGSHAFTWHGAAATNLKSGIYYLRLTLNGQTDTQKFCVLR